MERTITFTMEDALISPMGLAILAGAGLVEESDGGVTHFTERLTAGESGAVELTHTASENHPIYYAVVEEDGSLPDTLTLASKEADVKGKAGDVIFVDYYAATGVLNIDIEPGKFSGNFYLEAATLFRDTDGKDHAAEFIIPNCRVQSNFTFTMAATGDPSTFTFTMDAFPGYTAYDKTKKVLCAIQVLGDSASSN